MKRPSVIAEPSVSSQCVFIRPTDANDTTKTTKPPTAYHGEKGIQGAGPSTPQPGQIVAPIATSLPHFLHGFRFVFTWFPWFG